MITYALEPFSEELFAELEPLLELNHEEAGYGVHAPCYMLYDALEKGGGLRIYTLRISGNLVGYAVFTVGIHQQTSELTATNDAIYVVPEARRHSIKFLKWALDQVGAVGCRVIQMCDSAKAPIEALANRMGFEKVSTVYRKEL